MENQSNLSAPIYVASSWRNPAQPAAVHILRRYGLNVYDFREPRPGEKGFAWSDIDPAWKSWTPEAFIQGLDHGIALRGYGSDWCAMKEAGACVLLMPCGRSAHLEAGYFVGAGKPLHIVLSDGEPELMYLMAREVPGGRIWPGLHCLPDVAEALGGQEPPADA